MEYSFEVIKRNKYRDETQVLYLVSDCLLFADDMVFFLKSIETAQKQVVFFKKCTEKLGLHV